MEIASGVLGEDASGEPAEIICDGVKEFCNIVCGNVTGKLAQRGKAVDISPPAEVDYLADGYNVLKGKQGLFYPLASTLGEILLILVEY